MLKGVAFALIACFIWGLIFVVPEFMHEFTPFEVVLGRYFFYGLLSSLFFVHGKYHKVPNYPLSFWKRAVGYSFVASLAYYMTLVMALRYATPPITALILGLCPIPVTLFGTWKKRECDFIHLALPSILLFVGLILINAPHLIHSTSPSSFLFGLINAFISLSCWSWYAVVNARFLKEHPYLPAQHWSTMIGLANLAWVILITLLFIVCYPQSPLLHKYFSFNESLQKFLFGSIILGFVCSWLGAFFWNKASRHIPISLAGQLLIFETIFGLLFVYYFSNTLPSFSECCGIALLLVAVSRGVYLTSTPASLKKR